MLHLYLPYVDLQKVILKYFSNHILTDNDKLNYILINKIIIISNDNIKNILINEFIKKIMILNIIIDNFVNNSDSDSEIENESWEEYDDSEDEPKKQMMNHRMKSSYLSVIWNKYMIYIAW